MALSVVPRGPQPQVAYAAPIPVAESFSMDIYLCPVLCTSLPRQGDVELPPPPLELPAQPVRFSFFATHCSMLVASLLSLRHVSPWRWTHVIRMLVTSMCLCPRSFCAPGTGGTTVLFWRLFSAGAPLSPAARTHPVSPASTQ